MEKEKSFDSSLSVCTKDYKYSKGGESMGEISSKRDFRVLLAQSSLTEKFPYLLDHKDFDPATHSKMWTSKDSEYSVYVTAQDGLDEAMIRGDNLICVASELVDIPSHAYKCVVDPHMPYTERQLSCVSDVIDSLLEWSNVTVYCAMGMERSPLAVMFWLSKRFGYIFNSINYDILRNERPIIVDRRSYLEESKGV